MTDKIWHGRHIIAEAAAHFNSNRFTSTISAQNGARQNQNNRNPLHLVEIRTKVTHTKQLEKVANHRLAIRSDFRFDPVVKLF